MARRPRIIQSEIYFPIIIGLHLILWAVDLALYNGPISLSEGENPIQRVLGEVMSSWVITVFGFNLLMATRARWVERIFGGLDKMYLIHRRAGVIAMVLLFVHFGTVPRYPEFTVGKPLGFAAMVFIFIGVVLSAAQLFKRRLPYQKWLSMHRLMGPFYLLGVAHAYTVPTLISHLPLIRTYVFGMAVMGVASWIYTVFIHRRVHPRKSYTVTSSERLGASLLALELAPKDAAMNFLPGQFAFFSFRAFEFREAHPFTMASHPAQDRLRIAVKAAGDYTGALQDRVEVGDVVEVEGPYGQLTQATPSSRPQIWVAGGIGITPFLALARDLQETPRQVTMYWTVRTRDEAHFDGELRELAHRIPTLTYHLWLSNQSGRLSLETIPEVQDADDVEVFICGPAALRDSLTDQLHARGIKGSSVHSEEFTFR